MDVATWVVLFAVGAAVLARAGTELARSGDAIAVGLTALAALALLTPDLPSLGWVGLDTVVIAGAYFAAVAWFRRSPDGRLRAGVLPTPIGWARSR